MCSWPSMLQIKENGRLISYLEATLSQKFPLFSISVRGAGSEILEGDGAAWSSSRKSLDVVRSRSFCSRLSVNLLSGKSAIRIEIHPPNWTIRPANRNGKEKQIIKMLSITLSPKPTGSIKNGTRVNGIPKQIKKMPDKTAPSRCGV